MITAFQGRYPIDQTVINHHGMPRTRQDISGDRTVKSSNEFVVGCWYNWVNV